MFLFFTQFGLKDLLFGNLKSYFVRCSHMHSIGWLGELRVFLRQLSAKRIQIKFLTQGFIRLTAFNFVDYDVSERAHTQSKFTVGFRRLFLGWLFMRLEIEFTFYASLWCQNIWFARYGLEFSNINPLFVICIFLVIFVP